MTTMAHQPPCETRGASDVTDAMIIESRDEADLAHVLRPNVQAVIFTPVPRPEWMDELAAAVESGAVDLTRTVISSATSDEIACWLNQMLPTHTVSSVVRDTIQREILALVARAQELTHAEQFMLRVLTEAPTPRCGFHIDTVMPRSPTIGLLRVFNGVGTDYVHPENVTNMRDFYRDLSRHERLAKELEVAATHGDEERYRVLSDAIATLDAGPTFLRASDAVRVVPTGAIVAFKHLDVRLHWSNHPKSLTWIHRSPSHGPRRLVVNVTAREAQPRRQSL